MKKTTPIDTAVIERATSFKATVFVGTGRYETETRDTLAEAREIGAEMARVINNGRKAMIYAVAGGRSVFVPDSYQSPKDEGKETGMNTNLSSIEVAKLTATVTGGGFKRANSKEAAVKRFAKAIEEAHGVSTDGAAFILGLGMDEATRAVEAIKAGKTIADMTAPQPTELKSAAAKRKAAIAVAADAAPKAEKPAKAKPTSGAKPAGKRAAIQAAAEAGELPPAPDFSAPTHARFRKKLDEVVALVEAGDVKGLKAFAINPVSSSPKAIARYRDLAVIALEAKKTA